MDGAGYLPLQPWETAKETERDERTSEQETASLRAANATAADPNGTVIAETIRDNAGEASGSVGVAGDSRRGVAISAIGGVISVIVRVERGRAKPGNRTKSEKISLRRRIRAIHQFPYKFTYILH